MVIHKKKAASLDQRLARLGQLGHSYFMAKMKSIFVCQTCGTTRPKWEGQCRDCGSWNSFVEEKEIKVAPTGRTWTLASSDQGPSLRKLDTEVKPTQLNRWKSGMGELDRVLGGGLVPGSYILLGGDPGIGKSTLLMQMAGRLANEGRKVLYISGEESVDQTALRAQRLGVRDGHVKVGSENRLPLIISFVEQERPDVLIVDSIQTIYLPELQSAPGTVSQVRECAAELMSVAKGKNTTVFLVGHITKDGSIAGPKTLEHIVDTVLHFEGDPNHQFRILRAQKNRFGPTNEMGVFQMSGIGLEEVENPSELFLAERGQCLVGSAVFPAMEGTRPVLCEIQSLTTASYMASPRRTSVGFDTNRVHLMSAVLDKHLDLSFAKNDVFVSIVGGLRISEPAADLAAAAAMLSTLQDQTVDAHSVFFGEVGLTGEVRAATFALDRLREAEKLGFKVAVLPKGNQKHVEKSLGNIKMKLHFISQIQELANLLQAETSSSKNTRTNRVIDRSEEVPFN